MTTAPLRTWVTGDPHARPALVELWPDRVRERCRPDGSQVRDSTFASVFRWSRLQMPLSIEAELCREITRHAGESGGPALTFWKGVGANGIERVEVEVRGHDALSVTLDGDGVLARSGARESAMRLDRFFFLGPAALPELPLALRRDLRARIAAAAGLPEEEGFPLLDYRAVRGAFESETGEEFAFTGHQVIHSLPSVDPYGGGPESASWFLGVEEVAIELDRHLPAWLGPRREEIAAMLRDARCGGAVHPSVTPLHLAAREGDARAVGAALAAGVQLDAQDLAGFTPLMAAAAERQAEVVALLLARGAKVDLAAVDGSTALVVAAGARCPDAVAGLLAAGADLDRAADRVHTPHRRAAWRADAATLELLAARKPVGTADAALFLLRRLELHGARVRLIESGKEWCGMWDHDDDPPNIDADVFVVEPWRGLPADLPRCVLARATEVRGEIHFFPEVRIKPTGEGDLRCSPEWVGLAPTDAFAERLSAFLAGGCLAGLEPVQARAAWEGRTEAVAFLRAGGVPSDRALTRAAERGHVDVLDVLLAPPLPPGPVLAQALAEAGRRGHLAAVERLIAAGADPNATLPAGGTPLHSTAGAWIASPACVRALLAAGGDPRSPGHPTPALHLATTGSKDPEVAGILLSAGADPGARSEAGRTALHCAAGTAEVAVVRALIEAGAPVDARNAEGATPLHVAARRSRPRPVIRALVAAGADIEARDGDGRTPLLVASGTAGGGEAMDALLAAGARGDVRDGRGRTALMECTERTGLGEAMAALVEAGAVLDAVDGAGDTALIHAARRKNASAAGVLLRLGARTDIANRAGETAWDLARGKGGRRVLEVLERAGQK